MNITTGSLKPLKIKSIISYCNKKYLVIVILMLFLINFAQATTYTVNNSGDSGAGSLRQAILDANSDGSATAGSPHIININIAGTVLFNTSFADIVNHMTFNGHASGSTINRASGTDYRIFTIVGAFVVEFNRIIMKNGNPGVTLITGGAIQNTSGTVTLNDCVLDGNVTSAAAGGNGGAVNNITGTLNINNSTIKNNTAGNAYGGGIYVQGGTVILTNCTIQNNDCTSNGNGGGIGVNVGATLTMINCTVIDNSVAANTIFSVGGLVQLNFSTLHIINTIIANNDNLTLPADYTVLGTPILLTNNNNIVEACLSTDCTIFTSNQDPNLAALDQCGLQDNYRPQTGSFAIDGGTVTGAPSVDICGTTWSNLHDIGSVESAVLGSALDFDAIDDYVALPMNRSDLTDFTIMAWFRFDGNTTDGKTPIFGGASGDFFIGKNTGNTDIGMQDNAYISNFGTASNAWDGSWHHIAVTRNNTTGFNSLYLDGTLTNTAVFTGGSGQINIGFVNEGAGFYFNGLIDEVRFWEHELCPTEISTQIDCELVGTSGLIAYYNFNQGIEASANPTETTLIDATAASNDGTLNNFALTGASSNWVDGTGNGVTNNCSTFPEIDLQGNSLSIVANDATPSLLDHTDFGNAVESSGTVIRTFTIENKGTGSLNITNLLLSGGHAADFTLGAITPASPIPTGSSATFTITFDPSDLGLRSTQFAIFNNDCNENLYIVSIQGTGVITLPIELTRFYGESKQDFNDIYWTTASEVNNNHFILEKSIDGIVYKGIAQISSKGNSFKTQAYNYRDYEPTNLQYYRLKQVDHDDIYTYSDIIIINSKKLNLPEILLYPNPSLGNISIEMSKFHFPATLRIINPLGLVIRSQQYIDPTLIHLNIDQFPGYYLIEILTNDNTKIVRKILIK